MIGAYFFIKYTTPIYEVSSTIMIENESPSFSSERLLQDMDLFSQKRNILNEKIILKSYDMINETLKQFDFIVSYYSDNGYSLSELYKASPFIVQFDSANPQLVNCYFGVEILSNNKFKIAIKGEELNLYSYQKQKFISLIEKVDFSGEYAFGQTISTPYFNFKLVENKGNATFPIRHGDTYKFSFNNINQLTLQYKESLKVDLFEKGVDVLSISLQGNNIAKTTDFLNRLTQVYISKKLEKKNQNANNTIRFIDEQLFTITDSLTNAENRLQNYKSSTKMMDVGFQTQKLFEHLLELEKQKAVLLAQKKYFDYALKTIKEGVNLDDIMVPSTIGIADVNLNKLIVELTELSAKKTTLAANTSEKSPVILNLEAQIENNKKQIINNLNSLMEVSEISIRDINNQLAGLEDEAKKLPATEQKLFGFERQFTLSNEIYNFLMQKRAEAQIAKASNTADSEIIDVARGDVAVKKSARYSQILIVALLLGLLLPSLIVFLIVLLKDAIMMRQDIEDLTHIPIVGSIVQSKLYKPTVFLERPKSSIAESFRTFYTNLQYFTRGKEHQIILITSSMPREGKTFNAINLASVFASFGKKTCLLSFDLRLAKVHLAFNISGEIGLSTYLINYSNVEDIIFASGIENLDIIPAGPAPPNPLELIASGRTDELFAFLRTRYECVIIDSPPLGVVADALLLAKYSDVNVIITRQNITRKKVLLSVVKDLEANGIKNKAILFNGIKQSRISGYGYSYGYGYGYGYYKDEKEIWWKRLLRLGEKWKNGKNVSGR